MSSQYSDRLRDPRWQRRRLEIFERDGWSCTVCGAEDKTLHVNHLYYVTERQPWEYPAWCLATVCETCHGRDCRHGTDSVERLIDAIGGFCRDFRDFEDLASTLESALRRGLPRNPSVPPIAIVGAAGYALQKALQAMNLGHDPALVMAAIDAAFDSKFGALPEVLPIEHRAWIEDFDRAGTTETAD